MLSIDIKTDDAGQRLDRFLRKYLPEASLGSIYKMIRKDVKVNGKRAKIDLFLNEGDVITLYLSDDRIKSLSKKKLQGNAGKAGREFLIVHEDENVILVNKPKGLLTHGDFREKKKHLTNQVIDYLIETGSYVPRVSKTFTPAPANRLDRNTSGLVVFGKNAEAMRTLTEIFRNRQIDKKYLAICHGFLYEELEIKGYMRKTESSGIIKAYIDKKPDSDGKPIHTVVYPIATGEYDGERYSLVEVELKTGRTHQIRAHLSSIGHSLLGDEKYGGKAVPDLKIRNQMLCAYKLKFKDIRDDSSLADLRGREFKAAPDKVMDRAMKKIFKGDIFNGK
ncbi:MAG: RluA family pseudouridine synthase [Clostridiales bacterium]|nr:RluA family pseudouridine synthase [Clostridiales bacterium]